jgi:hypothetical protein
MRAPEQSPWCRVAAFLAKLVQIKGFPLIQSYNFKADIWPQALDCDICGVLLLLFY